MGKQKTSSAPSKATQPPAANSGAGAKDRKPVAKGPPARRGIVKSGNAGNSSAAPKPVVDDGRPPPLFPAGYKTPLSLLNERCQKNGWQKPDVQPFKTPTGYSCVVKISRMDPKNGIETVTFKPPTSADSPIRIEKETSLEAKHWGSVYALHRFASGLQLGMVLPPQVRDYWSALQAEKKKGNQKDAWMYAADPFEAASSRDNSRAATPAPSANNGGASGDRPEPENHVSEPRLPKDTPEVHMSSELRELVQSTIRQMRALHSPAHDGSDPPYKVSQGEQKQVLAELGRLGYREGHIRSALSYIASTSPSSDPLLQGLSSSTLKETILQYLQITLTEEELPSSLHGYKGKPDAKLRLAKQGDTSSLKLSWLIEKIVKDIGYPEAVVTQAVHQADGDESLAYEILARRLVGWQDEWSVEALLAANLGAASQEQQEKRQAEQEALQSLLGDRYRRLNAMTFEIDIPAAQEVSLRVMFSERSTYPSPFGPGEAPHLPVFAVISTSSSVPGYIRMHLIKVLLQRIRDPGRTDWLELLAEGEGGIIYEMAAFLEEQVDSVLSHPPSVSEVVSHFKDNIHIAQDYLPARTETQGRRAIGHAANRKITRGDHAALCEEERDLQATDAYQSMLEKRRRLPAWSARENLVSLIENNRVVIVSGATGSGKTTQVPAFVMENELLQNRGGAVSIVCTQPRRISALGVAARVAQERAETVGQNLVGYAIRGERKASPKCRLLFCTTGILLQRLSRGGDPDLDGVSHVFVDEVHERSLDSDFLLLMLKEVLQKNKRIKVILMSATADSERFSAYFGGAPCIEIPGQTHPVEDFYLEDVLRATRYKAPSIKASRKYSQEENDELRMSFIEQGIADPELVSTLSMLARSERIDYDLIAATVAHLAGSSRQEQAILVFVTGVGEITQTIRAIQRVVSSSEAEILPLHANLSSAEQARVFKKYQKRKVIVSTNVAETSITVDDVVFVVDTGRVKETRFDAESGMQRLVEDWNSLAGARQRRGRAGRTQPGQCWKLYPRWQERRLPSHNEPEMLRTPLSSLVLQVKALRVGSDVSRFLTGALDAPSTSAIQEALDTLTRLGALQEGDSKTANLTSLGRNLALLPLDLRLGKMLILASIFGCLDPVLTLCSALSTRSIFNAPFEKRDELAAARAKFASGKSDLLTDLNAIESGLHLLEKGSELRKFCDENFISQITLREILSLRTDYISALRSAGFDVQAGRKPESPSASTPHENLLKAIIFAGTAKAVRIRLPQARYEATIGGTTQVDHDAKEVRFFDDEGRVFLHPASILFGEAKLKNGYLTHFNKSVTTKPYLRDATELPLYALLIFGRSPRADALKGGLMLDEGKIRLKVPPHTAVLMNELRRLLDVELDSLIDDPVAAHSHSPVITTILKLLSCEDY